MHHFIALSRSLEIFLFQTNNGYRLDLGVQKEMSKGTTVLSIFAPFWFVNKTKRTLYFKVRTIFGREATLEL